MLNKAEEDYLKYIYEQAVREPHKVTVKDVAEYFSYSEQSVYEMMRRLQTKHLIKYEPYRGITLLKKGKEEAIRMIRTHRIWEVFLEKHLGYAWEEVHEEAEKLEHMGSEKLLRRIYALLGEPKTCQHGNPIPPFDEKFTYEAFAPLTSFSIGEKLIVKQVKDNKELLRYLTTIDLKLNATIEIINIYADLKQIEIKLDNRSITMSQHTAQHIFVQRVTD